ncbi:hypothetical protein B0A48_18545 [Cryoendolithus antarcticus]|uniref:Uncharacterized protein n=1 Tax=Cryoendolithus antarcticus TaxID=1507870 RepID=A0A1V8S8W4_9PEZI|nr:hypothetical protein B0A48_18545 [Cryoendolithus antarcticus]
MFLWVSLVYKRLEEVHADKVFHTLHETPPGLGTLYSRIFFKLNQGDSSMVKRYIRMLKVMMIAIRPLAVVEVESATVLGREEVLSVDVVEITRLPGWDRGESPLEACESYGHDDIALTSIAVLEEHRKADPLNLPRLDSTWTAAEPTEIKEKKELLTKVEYATTFCTQHIDSAGPSGLVDGIHAEGGQVDAPLSIKFSSGCEV